MRQSISSTVCQVSGVIANKSPKGSHVIVTMFLKLPFMAFYGSGDAKQSNRKPKKEVSIASTKRSEVQMKTKEKRMKVGRKTNKKLTFKWSNACSSTPRMDDCKMNKKLAFKWSNACSSTPRRMNGRKMNKKLTFKWSNACSSTSRRLNGWKMNKKLTFIHISEDPKYLKQLPEVNAPRRRPRLRKKNHPNFDW